MNSSNSSENTASFENYACPYTNLLYVLNSQLVPVLSGIGIVTNTYCVIVFARIIYFEKQNGHMFRYLLVKAVHDAIQFCIQVFAPLYYCVSCSTYQTFSAQVWYIYFYYYVECINEMCSGALDVAATFDCLITINKKMAYCQKIMFFYLVTFITFLYSAIYYIFFIFNFEIVAKARLDPNDVYTNMTGSKPVEYFVYEYTEFSKTSLNTGLRLWHGLSRDVIIIVLLVVLNIMILITMKRSTRKKKKLLLTNTSQVATRVEQTNSQPSSSHKKPSSLATAQDAERNMTLMIVLSGVNYFIGHSPSFIFYCVLFNKPSVFRSCFRGITLFLFYLVYVTPFFIYFGVNRIFRSYALCITRKKPRVGDLSSITRA